jgi:hypothetical protein
MVKVGPAQNRPENQMVTVQSLLPWLDLLWAPLALLLVPKGVKIKTAIFTLLCAFLLRLQVEFLQQIGMGRGFFGLMESLILPRGQITYGVFILIFLILAYFSPGVNKHVHIAASITIMMSAFCVSSLVMVL